MKKIYNAPEASLLCFRPMEDLANDLKNFIDFGELVELSKDNLNDKQGGAATTSANDIRIDIKL